MSDAIKDVVKQIEDNLVLYEGEGGWVEMGGKGSGHWRHRGRKGKRGGSAPSKGQGGPSLRQRVLDEEFAKSIGIPIGYSWEEGDWAAEWILQHQPGEQIPKQMVRRKDLLDNVVLGPEQTFGDWSRDVLQQTRPRMLVRESQGLLDARDEALLRDKMPLDVWLTRRSVEVVPEKYMPDVNRLSLEKEWGISRYAIYPDIKPVGTWDFGDGEFVITVNAEAEKYGLTKRHVFYHEFSHTIPDFAVYSVTGKPKPSDTAGNLADRFAIAMEQQIIGK